MSNELATLSNVLPAVDAVTPEKMRAIMEVNQSASGISAFDLQRIKVPTGANSAYWLLDNEKPTEAVRGVILVNAPQRRYYSSKIVPGAPAAPPDCISADMAQGIGTPGGGCAQCRYNQWGSSTGGDGNPGRGKACAEYRYLFFLREGGTSIMPYVLQVPPTSLGSLSKYLVELTGKLMFLFEVVTEFTLKTGGQASEIGFKAVQQLDTASELKIREYVNFWKPIVQGLPLTNSD